MVSRLRLVQEAKVSIAEICRRARQMGYVVSYGLLAKLPVAILHNSEIKDGSTVVLKEIFNNNNPDCKTLNCKTGDSIKWSQFKFRKMNSIKCEDFTLYCVI